MTESYDQFLRNAVAVLSAEGAQTLLPPPMNREAPPWATGWDSVLLSDAPGAQTLYAFTSAGSASRDEVQSRLDRLAQGIANSGMLRGAPMSLVAIIAQDGSMVVQNQGKLIGLTPKAFYTGLRPTTWLADLAAQRVYTPGLKRPDTASTLESTLGLSGAALEPHRVDALRQTQVARNQAFYELMRGRQPVVSYALIAVNLLVFGLESANGGSDNVQTLLNFGALSPILIQQGQWWRLCTAIFLHAGVAHILFNMTSLFAVGTLAERLYGSPRFLAIYLGAGLIGSTSSVVYGAMTGQAHEVGVGASGAIFGVAAALVTVRFQRSNVIPDRLRRRISSSMLPLVAFSLAFAYLTPHVDNSAHLGGIVGGAILSFVFPLTKGRATPDPVAGTTLEPPA